MPIYASSRVGAPGALGRGAAGREAGLGGLEEDPLAVEALGARARGSYPEAEVGEADALEVGAEVVRVLDARVVGRGDAVVVVVVAGRRAGLFKRPVILR